MPIAFVQSALSLGSNNVTFTTRNIAGNAIIVAVFQQLSGVQSFTVSDTDGNKYSSLGLQSNVDGTAFAEIFYAFNITGDAANSPAPNSIGVVSNLNSPPNAIAIHEFSGINAVDTGGGASGTGNAQTTGAIPTGFSNELLFSYEMGIRTSQLSVSTTPGWTLTQSVNSISSVAFLTQYQIATAQGTFAATTVTTSQKSTTNKWIIQAATFTFINPPPGAGGVSQANVGLQLYPNYNGINWTQPGGKGTQVFPAQARNQPFAAFPVPGQVIDEVGMSLWPVWGCGHGSDVARIFKDFDPTTKLSAACVCCPICSYIQYLIEPYENATSSIAMTNQFPIIIP